VLRAIHLRTRALRSQTSSTQSCVHYGSSSLSRTHLKDETYSLKSLVVGLDSLTLLRRANRQMFAYWKLSGVTDLPGFHREYHVEIVLIRRMLCCKNTLYLGSSLRLTSVLEMWLTADSSRISSNNTTQEPGRKLLSDNV